MRFSICAIVTMSIMLGVFILPKPLNAETYEYTLNEDFDLGEMNNVVHIPDNLLQLRNDTEPFNLIWIAVSGKGTVVKIDTKTGTVLGEYKTAPDGMGLNPSRTTVDAYGHVWVANRNESGSVGKDAIAPGIPPNHQSMGSVTYIGSPDTIWVDRNDNGVCDTSTGLGDVRAWRNAGGSNTLGGSKMDLSAEDECIIHFVRVHSTGTRHVSVDKNNDVWVSGTGGQHFDLIDDETGQIIRQEKGVGYGGYGGLIDENGVIWSSNRLLRWDTSKPLTGANGVNWKGYGHHSYGLGIDSNGCVWNSSLSGNRVHKFAPNGDLMGIYSHGDYNSQGVVAGRDDHIWVAHSFSSGKNTVGHLLNDGTFIGNVVLDPHTPARPTGVAVDGDGFIWATGYSSRKAYKIDPGKGPMGDDGVTPVGEVVLTTEDLGGYLYNYSDMTGSTIIAPPNMGEWEVVKDSNIPDAIWRNITWTQEVPGDSNIRVTAASSADGVNFGASESIVNGEDLTLPDGQYLKVKVTFERSSQDGDSDGIKDSPILYDLSLEATPQNTPPDTTNAYADNDCLWPPNHKFVPVKILGVTDPDPDDAITITIDGITSDEPTATDKGSGGAKHAPDANGLGTDTAFLRAERSGKKDGRVYVVSFTADDGNGGIRSGTVTVKVPRDQSANLCPATDSGQDYEATGVN